MEQQYPDNPRNVPHGYCWVCAGLLPTEMQDSGGRFCCRVCEHIATHCGPEAGKGDECICCGAVLEAGKKLTCCDACARRLGLLYSRWHAAIRRGFHVKVCRTCGKPVVRGAWCSPECCKAERHDPEHERDAVLACDNFDGYTASSKELDLMHDGFSRYKILSLADEVRLVFAEASAFHGKSDAFEKLHMHIEGPEGTTRMFTLGRKRKQA